MNPDCRIARTARRDLQEIFDYWELEAGEQRAWTIFDSLINTALMLAAYPGAGIRADQFGPKVRRFPSGRYLIYYRPGSRGIDVLHIFHGARDQKRAWKSRRREHT